MTVGTIDREEQERRHHIRQWARFMITHLEGTDEARFLSYTEALARLRDLIDLELARVEAVAEVGGSPAAPLRRRSPTT